MSLLESGIPVEEQVVEEALNCISKDDKPSIYTQALAAYAFASSGGNNTERAEEMLTKLLQSAENKNGLVWLAVDGQSVCFAVFTIRKNMVVFFCRFNEISS